MSNLYWPVYKNLEKEVIELSYIVNFDDNQFKYIKDDAGNHIKTPVYSIKIGDLLVRCCTEIEALIQELTKGKDEDVKNLPTVNSGRPITTGCRLKYLHSIWGLDKKPVIISCSSMYFMDLSNKYFFPFQYNKDGYDDYYSAYNAIKHNRNNKTIYKGNIRYLLRAMASLYLLNIYHKNESIFLGKNSSITSIPSSSNLFAVEAIKAATTEENSVMLTLGKFKEAVTAVLVVKTTLKSKTIEKENSKQYLDSINSNLIELIKKDPNGNIGELSKRAFKMTSNTKYIKTIENSEYEAVLLKPADVEFYESQGCVREHDKEQLNTIREETELWKSTSKN